MSLKLPGGQSTLAIEPIKVLKFSDRLNLAFHNTIVHSSLYPPSPKTRGKR
jgi:hypothetical protein